MGTESSSGPAFTQQLILSPLFTGVRGREILGSSVLLAAFSTMGATAPVGSVQERRKHHDVCGRTSRQQGEGAPPIRGGLRWGKRRGHRRGTPLRLRLPRPQFRNRRGKRSTDHEGRDRLLPPSPSRPHLHSGGPDIRGG